MKWMQLKNKILWRCNMWPFRFFCNFVILKLKIKIKIVTTLQLHKKDLVSNVRSWCFGSCNWFASWKVLNTLFFIFFDFSFCICFWYPEVAIDWRMQWRAHCKYRIVFHNIRCHILKPKQLVVDWYFYELDITHKCKYTQKLNRTVARYQM